MSKVKALKLKLFLPSAHFRYPFTFQRRFSYPIPPYSTVLGFLTSLFNPEREFPKEEIKKWFSGTLVSVAGRPKSRSKSTFWFRNLAKQKHEERFGSPLLREKDGEAEHPGGQSPVLVETYEDLTLWIYLKTSEETKERLVRRIEKEIENLTEVLHLGRPEDVVAHVEVKNVLLEKEELLGNFRLFLWIPQNCSDKPLGLLQKVPACHEEIKGMRLFKFIPAYLSEGTFLNQRALLDPEEEVPVFFADPTAPCGGKT